MSDRTHSGELHRWRSHHADIAQLVERNLAKVEVAGSSPVVRSEASGLHRELAFSVEVCGPHGGVAERRGNGLQSRVHGFKSRLHLATRGSTSRESSRAIGAVVARFLDTEEVTGSNPVSPTSITAGQRPFEGLFPFAGPLRAQQVSKRRSAGHA